MHEKNSQFILLKISPHLVRLSGKIHALSIEVFYNPPYNNERIKAMLFVLPNKTRCLLMFVSQPLPKVMIMTLLDNLNPHLPNGLQLDESIFHWRGVWCTFFIFIIFFYRNSCEQTVTVEFFNIASRGVILSSQRTIKALIRLRGCAG